jgi:glycosyltransferase involved in cell wall biosynthesis
MSAKVTIGVCVKDAEEIIERCLESIVKQDFPHELLELIIVDDGSRDRTLPIMKEFTSKVDIETLIVSHDWRGLAFSRQVAVDNANGKYLVWVDSDYVLPNDFIRKHVEFMEKNPNVGAACGREIFHGENVVDVLESANTLQTNPHKTTEVDVVDVGGAIYRLETMNQVGGFDPNLKGAGEDVDITTKIKETQWKLSLSPAKFYHRHRKTWRSLWAEYSWFGYGMHYVNHKHRRRFSANYIPPIAFVQGLRRSFRIYKQIHQKKAFLLPLHYVFKHTAWFFGFVQSHRDGHGHVFEK